ncbi:MAG: thioredoxin domain-containing protein [Clostridia bacterium]|nr:thioredoxin domain-containing protein [Clostridia bacterium]
MTALNKVSNRLADEKSPYLLQHAHNPVDWYPWGEKAFDRALGEDKPIFLSIGYSTCHWCHVMERESFEDGEVAEILNKYFVAVKVDREERPDIDTIYMSFCQALTGSGGWPLTVFLTPEQKPFYAGTYFPKHSQQGMPGLMELLESIHEAWDNNREDLISSGDQITEIVEKQVFHHSPGELKKDILHRAYHHLEEIFDPGDGGFGTAPKFPSPHQLTFLLRYWRLTNNEKALDMVEKTLESMYRGGIYDHIGFGFARYSVDQKWLVPHFEKMLYDNALLALCYGEAYQATQRPLYKKVVKEIFTYILRDMSHEKGGFYSAEDADSEGVEGKFYIWTPEEIKKVLGEELGEAYCETYDITRRGNFEGASIPNLIKSGSVKGFDDARKRLFSHREKRIHPHKDDKILTAWNGLMIAALAYNSRVLDEPEYYEAAEKALTFIMKNLRRDDGRLLARYRDGEAAYLAYVDDYAFLIWGLLELYQTNFDLKHLELALELHRDMMKLFWDTEEGGLYLYGDDAEDLLVRPKELYDGAVPSGNSAAAVNMLRLYHLTGDQSFRESIESQQRFFGNTVNESPLGFTHFLQAVFLDHAGAGEITIVGDKKDDMVKEMLKVINNSYLPELGAVLKKPGKDSGDMHRILPSASQREQIGNKATAHLCRNFSCQKPITDIDELAEKLQSQ